MISYRNSRKISSYLVRAKLYPINRTVYCYKCSSKCRELCKYVTETDIFTSTATGKSLRQTIVLTEKTIKVNKMARLYFLHKCIETDR